MSKSRGYVVRFKEVALVVEFVEATTAAEAIEKAKAGEGERWGFEIDEERGPFAYTATRDGSS